MMQAFLPKTVELFGVEFHLYGFFLGIALLVVYLFIDRNFKERLKSYDYLIVCFIGLVGARALFLIHNIALLAKEPKIILTLQDGGLAFYGGIIGFIAGIAIVSKMRKIPFFDITDKVALIMPIAQAIGRLGNFVNNELYGAPTNLPWKLYIPPQDRLDRYNKFSYFHPTFMYESILSLLNFAILYILFKVKSKKLKEGTLSFVYLIVYGLIRIILNRFRIDKVYWLGLETSDFFSLLFIAIGGLGLAALYFRESNQIKISNFFSYIFNGYTNIILVVSMALMFGGGTAWFEAAEISFFTIFMPMIIWLLYFRGKGAKDIFIKDRSKRPLFFLLQLLVCNLPALFIAWQSQNQSIIFVTLSLVLGTIVMAIVSVLWKISGHMIYLIFMVSSLYVITGQSWVLYFLILTPIVAWSRVKLKHHTAWQTIAGTAVGFGIWAIASLV